jgi:hypothetical protein
MPKILWLDELIELGCSYECFYLVGDTWVKVNVLVEHIRLAWGSFGACDLDNGALLNWCQKYTQRGQQIGAI